MKRWLLIIAALGATVLVLELNRPRMYPSVQAPAQSKAAKPVPLVPSPTAAAPDPAQSRLSLMLQGKIDRSEYALNPTEIHEYIRANHTNALSLVTAFEATRDREFLKLAARFFPNDPFVQAKILMHDVFPEDRAKWIAAFKQSSPDNAFPNLLAARERMKSGDAAGAVQEIAAAASLPYNDFTRQGILGLTEAYLAAGRPVGEAHVLGSDELLLPQLAPFKQLGQQLAQSARDAAATGNSADQRTYLEAGWQLGGHLREGGADGVLITELVGLAIQNLILADWPAGEPAPFLDLPVGEQLAANREYRADIRRSTTTFGNWLPIAPEHEILSYLDRLRSLGESDAMAWLRGRHPELVPDPTRQ